MAPIFEAQVFKKLVIPTLEEAYFAWGLDYVWPFLLGYPHDKASRWAGCSGCPGRLVPAVGMRRLPMHGKEVLVGLPARRDREPGLPYSLSLAGPRRCRSAWWTWFA